MSTTAYDRFDERAVQLTMLYLQKADTSKMSPVDLANEYLKVSQDIAEVLKKSKAII